MDTANEEIIIEPADHQDLTIGQFQASMDLMLVAKIMAMSGLVRTRDTDPHSGGPVVMGVGVVHIPAPHDQEITIVKRVDSNRPIVVVYLAVVETKVRMECAVGMVPGNAEVSVGVSGRQDLAIGLDGDAANIVGIRVFNVPIGSEAGVEGSIQVVLGQIPAPGNKERTIGVHGPGEGGLASAKITLHYPTGTEAVIEREVAVEADQPEVRVNGSDGEDLAIG